MHRLAINGRFLTRPITGVDRYAREIVAELDNLLSAQDGAVIVIPTGANLIEQPVFKNIEYVEYGSHSGHVWEQLELSRFISSGNFLGLHLCMTAPISNPGIVCVHDMAIRANPNFFSRKFVLWYKVLFRAFEKRAKAIITVSEFSKREIEKYYPGTTKRISVVPNSWQHINKVDADDEILERNDLQKGSFWFAMSSLAPNKNLKWLVDTALNNPRETVAIAGGINTNVFGKHSIPEADNVKYLGYVSDGEAKSLLRACKGFLYPTFYEGFGIPPMEAMACDAAAVVSDTEIMREVYSDTVSYVDPNVPNDDLNGLLLVPKGPASKTLEKYSWRDSAKILWGTIQDMGSD